MISTERWRDASLERRIPQLQTATVNTRLLTLVRAQICSSLYTDNTLYLAVSCADEYVCVDVKIHRNTEQVIRCKKNPWLRERWYCRHVKKSFNPRFPIFLLSSTEIPCVLSLSLSLSLSVFFAPGVSILFSASLEFILPLRTMHSSLSVLSVFHSPRIFTRREFERRKGSGESEIFLEVVGEAIPFSTLSLFIHPSSGPPTVKKIGR